MRTRRRSARILLAAGFLFIAAPVMAQPGANAGPAKAKATTPEIPFESVPNFFKLPAGLYMGEGTGVATNSKGHVFVYVRSGETRLFEFDQNGAFVKEFGAGSYGFSFAHAVRVDKDDNVWAVDEGTNVVQKFSPDGKLLMVLGKRPDPLDQLALTPGGGQYQVQTGRTPFTGRPTSAGIRRATSSCPTATATLASSSSTRTAAS